LSAGGVDDALLRIVESPGANESRIAAIQALVRRNNTTCVPTLLKVAEQETGPVCTAALRALRTQASEKHVPSLVRLLLQAPDSSTRNNTRTAIAAILVREKNPSVTPLAQALDKTQSDDIRIALISLLPLIGNDQAQELVTVTLHSHQGELRKAAVRALCEWPTPAPLPELLRLARADDDSHVLALRGYIRLVELPANRANKDTVKMLQEAMTIAQQTNEKKAILALLPNYPSPEALAMAEATQSDSALTAEAKLAADKVQEILINKRLSGRASINNRDAQNAYDGNRNTRWATNRPMKPGDYYIIDIGVESVIEGVTLDAAGSRGDYPRGYEVFVSFDGGKWEGPIVSGKGTQPLSDIRFPQPVQGRYLKVVQTGTVPGLFWSIHDLKVHCK
jgi:HEAT repeat protein